MGTIKFLIFRHAKTGHGQKLKDKGTDYAPVTYRSTEFLYSNIYGARFNPIGILSATDMVT